MTVDCNEYQVILTGLYLSVMIVSVLTMAKIDSEYQISFMIKSKY